MRVKKNGIWEDIDVNNEFSSIDIDEIEWNGVVLCSVNELVLRESLCIACKCWSKKLDSGEKIYIWDSRIIYNFKKLDSGEEFLMITEMNDKSDRNWSVRWSDETYSSGRTLGKAIIECNLKMVEEVENS